MPARRSSRCRRSRVPIQAQAQMTSSRQIAQRECEDVRVRRHRERRASGASRGCAPNPHRRYGPFEAATFRPPATGKGIARTHYSCVLVSGVRPPYANSHAISPLGIARTPALKRHRGTWGPQQRLRLVRSDQEPIRSVAAVVTGDPGIKRQRVESLRYDCHALEPTLRPFHLERSTVHTLRAGSVGVASYLPADALKGLGNGKPGVGLGDAVTLPVCPSLRCGPTTERDSPHCCALRSERCPKRSVPSR